MDNKRPLIAHLCLFCSGAFWGLMAPVGKDAMLHGIDGIDLVSFRKLHGLLKGTPLPENLAIDTFLLGISPDGSPGSYQVVRIIKFS